MRSCWRGNRWCRWSWCGVTGGCFCVGLWTSCSVLPMEPSKLSQLIRPCEHKAWLPGVQAGLRRLPQHELHVLQEPRRCHHDGGRGQGGGWGGSVMTLPKWIPCSFHLALEVLLFLVVCLRGHPFMASTRKSRFLSPHETDPNPSYLWTSTCRRPEIHITLLKQLVQCPSRPKLKVDNKMIEIYVRLNYNLYYWIILTTKFRFLIHPKVKFLYKRANFFAWDEDRMNYVGSNFVCCTVCPSELDPSPSVWTS